MNLSKSFIRQIKPALKVKDYRDPRYTNLVLRVTPKGTKTFYLVYRNDAGKQQYFKLRRIVSPVQLPNILAEYSQALADRAMGVDPAKEKKKAKKEKEYIHTFGELVENYIELHVKPNLSKNTYKHTKSLMKVHIIPVLGNKKITDIKKSMIIKLLRQLQNDGKHGVANNVLTKIKAFYSWYLEDKDENVPDPTHKIKKIASNGSKRKDLSNEQIVELLKAMKSSTELSKEAKSALMVLLLTGARMREVLDMTSNELDFSEKLWHLGKTRKLKTGSSNRVIPLTDTLINILQDQKPYSKSGRVWNIASSTFAVQVWRFKKNELPNNPEFSAHVLRHTFTTLCQKAGVADDPRKALTGHKATDAHTTYTHYSYLDEKKEAMKKVDEYITELMKDGNNRRR